MYRQNGDSEGMETWGGKARGVNNNNNNNNNYKRIYLETRQAGGRTWRGGGAHRPGSKVQICITELPVKLYNISNLNLLIYGR